MSGTVQLDERIGSADAMRPAPLSHPAPGSPEELRRFAELQRGLAPMYRRVFFDNAAPRTVVVVPSLSLDREELEKLVGATHYEERLLCLLLLLRLPATRVVYVTSTPVAPGIVHYYLDLLGRGAASDVRDRLVMVSCDDGSNVSLTEKILARPAVLDRIRDAVIDPGAAHVTCFNSTPLERTLAVRLGIPLYGCDPALTHLGTKSGGRELFREAGVLAPPGYERLRDEHDLADALAALRGAHPGLRRAVVKLEEGFSGEGNAIFAFDGAPQGSGPSVARWALAELPRRLRFVAADETWDRYRQKIVRMGGIVEAFVDGAAKRSPSCQCRIDPLGLTHIVSTHDQVLGGATGQIFLGCTFPADASCTAGLHDASRRVADALSRRGVIGRFGIDFVSTRTARGWAHHAIEINLRKGGTTHPYLLLELLTRGAYDDATGIFHAASGRPCYYVASDNLHHPAFHHLTPSAVIDVAARHGLCYDRDAEEGVAFHLLGALSSCGKLGAVCIGATRERAHRFFRRLGAVLDRAARGAAAVP